MEHQLCQPAMRTLFRNVMKLSSHRVTVAAGPTSFTQYGPSDVSIAAARCRNPGLLYRSVEPGLTSATYVPETSTSVTLRPLAVSFVVFATCADGLPSGCAIWPIQRSMLACTLPPCPAPKK